MSASGSSNYVIAFFIFICEIVSNEKMTQTILSFFDEAGEHF